MFHVTDDLRIDNLRPLIPPAILMEELPVSEYISNVVANNRQIASSIVRGEDDRLLVIVGPCSIHDSVAALEYGRLLKSAASRFSDDLCIIMRVYFEKPRTTIGWKGLINDPNLDGSFDINNGLRIARRLLVDLGSIGIAAGHEFLDTISPQFLADLISWGAIGARTTESQVHRELASGLSVPVGFKNGTDGNIAIAVDAIRAAKNPHHFLSVTKQGITAIVTTKGNDCCHVILRGSSQTPNYDVESINNTSKLLEEAGFLQKIMVDCSHGNSNKEYKKQIVVAQDICEQIKSGCESIMGVMIESNLVEGNQKFASSEKLTYGQSITDGCISWKDTESILEELALSVQKKRRANKKT